MVGSRHLSDWLGAARSVAVFVCLLAVTSLGVALRRGSATACCGVWPDPVPGPEFVPPGAIRGIAQAEPACAVHLLGFLSLQ